MDEGERTAKWCPLCGRWVEAEETNPGAGGYGCLGLIAAVTAVSGAVSGFGEGWPRWLGGLAFGLLALIFFAAAGRAKPRYRCPICKATVSGDRS